MENSTTQGSAKPELIPPGQPDTLETPTSQPTQLPADQSLGKPQEIPANQRADKPDEILANQRADKPEEILENQRADKPEEILENQRADKPEEILENQRADKPEEMLESQRADKPEILKNQRADKLELPKNLPEPYSGRPTQATAPSSIASDGEGPQHGDADQIFPDIALVEPTPPDIPDQPTAAAIYKRLNRVMKPREDGSYLVPESVRNDYHNLDQRPTVVRLFERCGWDPRCLLPLDHCSLRLRRLCGVVTPVPLEACGHWSRVLKVNSS